MTFASLDAPQKVRLSVVIAVRDEAENIAPLIEEIDAALRPEAYELIFVDDGSADGTADALLRAAASRPYMRILTHGRACGKSAAVATGAWAAHGEILLLLDGDGQNNPAYLPQMVAALDAVGERAGMVQGERQGRKDTAFKRFQSRLANTVRGLMLRDGTRDTGCGLKVVRRDIYLRLPHFDALHRFTPALVGREGFEVLTFPVVDRARWHGLSKYGFWNRLWVGIVDMLGVWWLTRRRNIPEVVKVYPDAH
ncbi:glycosyltransferase family 2 protein [Aquabacter spiritensis]|uniref:Glycosyltransferase involved in cell wall biosynthesis n=1 Tax=Aquabacter spiritensis TaxID=933073 RepID=A0A4R3LQE5_9HYPH|nr:glycosyltransferase family 2 protein [Aquabacter spiritensis]TCT02662.1 glycosyltransferase involved in cell wall biosynthesis [Aquabacter spiritensis]